MRIISHRGNLDGPDINRENNIKSILECLDKSLDVEIDVYCKDGYVFLDHDGPVKNKYLFTEFCDLFKNYQQKLWVHCKNLDAIIHFNQLKTYNFNYFGHSNDDFVLTSHGFIFTKPGVVSGKNVVCVMPEIANLDAQLIKDYELVLTDYPVRFL